LTNGRIIKGWGKDLSKYICRRRHKYKEDSINECNKRICLWWKDVKRVGRWCFSKKHSIKKVLVDGGYDSIDNFGYLDRLTIYIYYQSSKEEKIHRVRTTLHIETYSTKTIRVIQQQLEDIKQWMAECAFSSIKRMFGEYMYILQSGTIS
jgi:hypothetical protein